jgi:NADH-quinone oxidoreductase subunit M
LAAAYFLRLLLRVTHGAATPAVSGLAGRQPGPQPGLDRPATLAGGLSAGEVVAWAPLVVLALAIGLLPAAVLGMAHDAVQVLVR